MTDPERQKATSDAADDARANGAHRLLLALGITGVLGVLLLAGVLLWQNSHINDQGTQISGLRDNGNAVASQAQQLAQQVRNMGGTPVVIPPSPGPQGPTGATGPAGPQGVRGPQGITGQSPPCLADPAHCQGAAGTNGANGTAGTAGPTGAQGPSGPQGVAGAQGPAGAQGDPGQSPAGWTTTYPDGSTQTCIRAQNFNPSSPQYTCTNSAPSLPAIRK